MVQLLYDITLWVVELTVVLLCGSLSRQVPLCLVSQSPHSPHVALLGNRGDVELVDFL